MIKNNRKIEVIAPASGDMDLNKQAAFKKFWQDLGFTVNMRSDLILDSLIKKQQEGQQEVCEIAACDKAKAVGPLKDKVTVPNSAIAEIFSANTLHYRVNHFIEALDSDADILMCYRGGYGSQQLIPYLLSLPKPAKEKILIGYSDITALHLFLHQQWGWKTVHAAVGKELGNMQKSPNNAQYIGQLLSSSLEQIEIPLGGKLNNVEGGIKGNLIGGNLALVMVSLATSWQIDAVGKILYLEDLNEPGYKIDRMLDQLWQANILQGVKAVIFGEFIAANVEEVNVALQRCAERANFPVYKTEYFGHGFFNYPLINGIEAEIIEGDGEIKLVQYLEYS